MSVELNRGGGSLAPSSMAIGFAGATLVRGRCMGSGYGTMIVVVSVITLVILFLLFVRDNYWNKAWGQSPSRLRFKKCFETGSRMC